MAARAAAEAAAETAARRPSAGAKVDIGGGREADDESVAATAAREWAEESLGVYGDGSDMAARVASSAASMRACLSATAAPGALGPVCRVVSEAYTMFAVAVPFVDTLIFQLARDENDAEAAEECNEEESAQGALRRRVGEKRDFAWVSLASLLAAGCMLRRLRSAVGRGWGG